MNWKHALAWFIATGGLVAVIGGLIAADTYLEKRIGASGAFFVTAILFCAVLSLVMGLVP